MAGIHAVAGSIRPPEGFSFEHNLNHYFICPLQTVMLYFKRADAISRLWPDNVRHSWLKGLDEADRTMWVDEFQHSSRTLGQVIELVMQKRDAHWVGPPRIDTAVMAGQATSSQPAPVQDANKRLKYGTGHAAQHVESNSSGKKFCRDFNSKKGCAKTGKRCDLHMCNGKTVDGNPCHQQHSACKCTNAAVPKR